MADAQDRAEGLDDDRIGADYPPEEPLASEDYGVTAAEERHDEPLAERIEREEPDQEPSEPPPLVRPLFEEGDELLDEERELVADAEVEPGEQRADPSGEVGARDAPANERVPPAAEEAAMRVDDERDA